MSQNDVDLASLLCSRLCHDLLSPVGAMNNGLELLADEHDPAMRERCMELLAESAKAAADKLKFFRLAFGAAGGFGDMVDPGEAKSVIEPLIGAGGRTQLEWAVPTEPMPKSAIKIILNLVLIANDVLVRGGTLFVGAETGADQLEIVIRASGPRIIMDGNIRDTLNGQTGPEQVDSRTSAAWMVRGLVTRNGGILQLAEPDPEHLVIGAAIRR